MHGTNEYLKRWRGRNRRILETPVVTFMNKPISTSRSTRRSPWGPKSEPPSQLGEHSLVSFRLPGFRFPVSGP